MFNDSIIDLERDEARSGWYEDDFVPSDVMEDAYAAAQEELERDPTGEADVVYDGLHHEWGDGW